MKRAIITVAALAAAFVSTEAAASCGPAFDGTWKTKMFRSQGQYTQSTFINNSKNDALHTSSETGTRLSSSGTIGGTILDIAYNPDFYGNLSRERVNERTCILNFQQPHVNTDTYGVVGSVVARQAKLTVKGRAIKWCWIEKGHQLGDCHLYSRTD